MAMRKSDVKKYKSIEMQLDGSNVVTIKGELVNGDVISLQRQLDPDNTMVELLQILSEEEMLPNLFGKKHIYRKRGVLFKQKRQDELHEELIEVVKLVKPAVKKPCSNILRNLDDDTGHYFCIPALLAKN